MNTFKQYILSENTEQSIDCRQILQDKKFPDNSEIRIINTLYPYAPYCNGKKPVEWMLEHCAANNLAELSNLCWVDKNNKRYFYNTETTAFDPCNGAIFQASYHNILILSDGKIHSTKYPAIIHHGGYSYVYDTYTIVSVMFDNSLERIDVNKIRSFSRYNDFKTLMQNIISQVGIKEIIDSVESTDLKHIFQCIQNISELNAKDARHVILYLIQPEIFSDKAAKILMDKIPLNLSYFLLTKHMELYSNILSCYSNKHKFIENMKEGDDIHRMGIASALERLIKHEDI